MIRIKINAVSFRQGITSLLSRSFAYSGYLRSTPSKKLSTVSPVFRVSIYLIYQAVFLNVLFRSPIRNFFDKPVQIRKAFRHTQKKVSLDLCHTIFRRLHDKLVHVFEIRVEVRRGAAAFFGKLFYTRSVKAVLGVSLETFFHNFPFSRGKFFFVPHPQRQAFPSPRESAIIR